MLRPSEKLNFEIARIIHTCITMNEFDKVACGEKFYMFTLRTVAEELKLDIDDVLMYVLMTGFSNLGFRYQSYLDEKNPRSAKQIDKEVDKTIKEIEATKQEIQDLDNNKFTKKQIDKKLEQIKKGNLHEKV